MRVPYSWLAEHVEVPAVDELVAVFNSGGLEVEAVERPSAGVTGVVVVEVRDVRGVEGSEKLSVVRAFDGSAEHEIVCGASNFAVGDRVPAALPGATLPTPTGELLTIDRRGIFGVTSNGMLASARELGVGDDHSGIWILDADAPLGAELGEWLVLDETVVVLELTPNRGDALSMWGLAADVSALTGARLHLRRRQVAVPGTPGVQVEIEGGCHRFTATTVEGVTDGPSPAWLRRRLAAAGVRPRGRLVDATNHAMLETGHPVHAFDRDRLAGPLLAVRYARAGERLRTLDGVDRTLDPDDLVIADAERVVALAGQIGGEETEVTAATTDVVLEVASFDAPSVLRATRRHKLFTEAARRFEKTVPDASVVDGADACVALLVELAGGTVTGRTQVWPDPRPRPTIPLRPARARAVLGIDIDAATQQRLLESLGCVVTTDETDATNDPARIQETRGVAPPVHRDLAIEGEVGTLRVLPPVHRPDLAIEGEVGTLRVLPPVHRPDLAIEEDLYEEVLRLHGYERAPERLPSTGQVGRRDPADDAHRRVRRALAGGGWTETLAIPLQAEADLEGLGLDGDDQRRQPLRLRNPLSAEETVLRTTLLPGLLRAVRTNVGRQVGDVAIFETGRVFLPPDAQEVGADGGPDDVVLPAEPMMLGFAACGAFEPGDFSRAARPVDLRDLLGAVDLVRSVLGLPAFVARPTDERPYHPGRAARLALAGDDVGVVGELHPRVVEALQVPSRTLAGELRLDLLLADGARPATPAAPSPLPGLRLDVAAVVPDDVGAAAVEAVVREGAGRRLTELTLFDVYTGPQVGEGRTSYAWRLRLEDPSRQLGETETREVIEAIDGLLAGRLQGRLRR